MFNRICVPPKEPERSQFDLGLLAEALIFYREVHLILGASSFQGLLMQLGPDLFLELITDDHLHIHYIDQMLGAITTGRGGPSPFYDVGIITAKVHDIESVAQKAFISATGKSGRGRRLANRFCRKVEKISYPIEITKDITADMQDGKHLEEFIRRRIVGRQENKDVGNLNEIRYRFSLVPSHGFQLHSNFNLADVCTNGANLPELLDPATVLSYYGTTVADMSLWAQLQTEAALTPIQADVLTARIDNLLTDWAVAADKISAFQDFVFDNARAIRETINSGSRNFHDLLPVLVKARRFSEWISNQDADVNLLKAYHKEVTTDTWIDKLPAKSVRWSLFTGAGIGLDAFGAGGVGTAAGVALSALDSFVMDKILKDWKPHHFVEGDLKGFIKQR